MYTVPYAYSYFFTLKRQQIDSKMPPKVKTTCSAATRIEESLIFFFYVLYRITITRF